MGAVDTFVQTPSFCQGTPPATSNVGLSSCNGAIHDARGVSQGPLSAKGKLRRALGFQFDSQKGNDGRSIDPIEPRHGVNQNIFHS